MLHHQRRDNHPAIASTVIGTHLKNAFVTQSARDDKPPSRYSRVSQCTDEIITSVKSFKILPGHPILADLVDTQEWDIDQLPFDYRDERGRIRFGFLKDLKDLLIETMLVNCGDPTLKKEFAKILKKGSTFSTSYPHDKEKLSCVYARNNSIRNEMDLFRKIKKNKTSNDTGVLDMVLRFDDILNELSAIRDNVLSSAKDLIIEEDSASQLESHALELSELCNETIEFFDGDIDSDSYISPDSPTPVNKIQPTPDFSVPFKLDFNLSLGSFPSDDNPPLDVSVLSSGPTFYQRILNSFDETDKGPPTASESFDETDKGPPTPFDLFWIPTQARLCTSPTSYTTFIYCFDLNIPMLQSGGCIRFSGI